MGECTSYPPQDLARLVLGYLEEEECTSAYEEFIKTSPHLDAFRTNYDNAVMSNFSSKSLKDVFGEYCAFKSYTRNCKIAGLRTRLLQCKTLLDTAQLLLANIDLKKIQAGEDGSRFSSSFNLPQQARRKYCEVCKSTYITEMCDCRVRVSASYNTVCTPPVKNTTQEVVPEPTVPLSTLVETTQLADLPGISDTAKRKCENQPVVFTLNSHTDPTLTAAVETKTINEPAELKRKTLSVTGSQNANNSMKTNDLMSCSDDINEILNIVSGTSASEASNVQPVLEQNIHTSDTYKRISNSERSFQDFATGVSSGNSKLFVAEAMPDSSTPENASQNNISMECKTYDSNLLKLSSIEPKVSNQNINHRRNTLPRLTLIKKKQDHYSDETDGSRDSIESSGYEANSAPSLLSKQMIASSSKNLGPKVTILSNDLLKTGNEDGTIVISKGGSMTTLRPLPGRPPGLKNFNSLPPSNSNSIIHVNGHPVFQKDSIFTKEQILAMPTVIVIQSTMPQPVSHTSTSTYTNTVVSTAEPCVATTDSGYRSLEPISMEIDPIVPVSTETSNRKFVPNVHAPTETVSLEKHTTPPKPLIVKKASSTPRRNSSSHVRVLDFTTPRRIITTEEIDENISPGNVVTSAQKQTMQAEIVSNAQFERKTETAKKIETVEITETLKKSKKDWDADLRALLPSDSYTPKPKKPAKKKPCVKVETSEKVDQDVKEKKKKTVKKIKPIKKRKVPIIEETEDNLPIIANVKPTINLIKDWTGEPKLNLPKNKDNVESKENYTPETDLRPTSDNPVVGKHNLSDFLLQTPYKTMMDNIQMETPRFIDPSVFDGPLSDIKIDNIPTPNFLNTPNFLVGEGKGAGLIGATPSSYSSRPTDYSSGGSYYKPDEHDFEQFNDLKPASKIIPDSSPVPSTSKIGIVKTPKNKIQKENSNTESKSSRPRRQCTLRVSYREVTVSRSGKDMSKLLKASKRDSQSPSMSSRDLSLSSQSSDSSLSSEKSEVIKDARELKEKVNNSKETNDRREEILDELERKRKRIIASLKKKTPIKNSKKRSSCGSFPKVKLVDIKMKNKTKTVAELRQTVGPRKMPNVSKEKPKKSMKNDKFALTHVAPVITKSRRKSSTPRKVDTYIVQNMDDSASVEMPTDRNEIYMTEDELPPLRVSSDDGSQDSRPRKISKVEETDDIRQIKAYIETTSKHMEPTVQELVQRGFDLETAKSIERDLLGTPSRDEEDKVVGKETGKIIVDVQEQKVPSSKIIVTIERSPQQDSDVSSKSILQNTIVPTSCNAMTKFEKESSSKSSIDNSEKHDSTIILEGDIIMVRETFDEESKNYFTFTHSENNVNTNTVCDKIDDNFGLHIQCDDLNIRVCLSKQEMLFDLPPKEQIENASQSALDSTHSSTSSSDSEHNEIEKETVSAVESISNMKPLYTPIKIDPNASLQRQCLDIFDSTLNSLDTPIKTSLCQSGEAITPHGQDEVAQESWSVSSKRKEPSSSPPPGNSCKKNKHDHQILMQNIDIESLLTKLHGDDNT